MKSMPKMLHAPCDMRKARRQANNETARLCENLANGILAGQVVVHDDFTTSKLPAWPATTIPATGSPTYATGSKPVDRSVNNERWEAFKTDLKAKKAAANAAKRQSQTRSGLSKPTRQQREAAMIKSRFQACSAVLDDSWAMARLDETSLSPEAQAGLLSDFRFLRDHAQFLLGPEHGDNPLWNWLSKWQQLVKLAATPTPTPAKRRTRRGKKRSRAR